MNRDTENALSVWGGTIVGVFFGTLYDSWIASLFYINIILFFMIIKLFANHESSEVEE